jgi:preprotein translocase subunit SecB
MTEPSQNAGPTPGPGTAANARQVLLQKIYVKDASLEVPQAPAIFTRAWQPSIDVQVNTEVKPLPSDGFHVVLTITVTAKQGDEIGFLAEVHQAGIFTVRGFADPAEREAVLGGYCPGLLFPFAREAVADLVQRAGFPQLLLQPINFEALYLEHQQRRTAMPAAAPTAPTH